MFIKLSNVPSTRGDTPKSSWVNSLHIVEMFAGETRQFAVGGDTRILQPAIPCTRINLTGDSALDVLETPEQIMDLLNGPQLHGAAKG